MVEIMSKQKLTVRDQQYIRILEVIEEFVSVTMMELRVPLGPRFYSAQLDKLCRALYTSGMVTRKLKPKPNWISGRKTIYVYELSQLGRDWLAQKRKF